MALNDAVPSSATDVFKRNAEDADRLLNASGSVTNRLGNQILSWEQISQSHAAWNNRGAWTTATAYAVNDIWQNGVNWYVVLSAYTSGASAAADIAGPNVVVLSGNFVQGVAGLGFNEFASNKNLVYPVDSVEDLAGLAGVLDDQQISLKGWHPDSDVGGGILYWDAAKPKSEHNGGTVFSPTVPFSAITSDYLDGVGETNPVGSGCWVRGNITALTLRDFGTYDSSTDCSAAASQALATGYPLVLVNDVLLDGVVSVAGTVHIISKGGTINLGPNHSITGTNAEIHTTGNVFQYAPKMSGVKIRQANAPATNGLPQTIDAFNSASALNKKCLLRKLRTDYLEYAAYTPVNFENTLYSRWYATNRFNLGNTGCSRINACDAAELYAQTVTDALAFNDGARGGTWINDTWSQGYAPYLFIRATNDAGNTNAATVTYTTAATASTLYLRHGSWSNCGIIQVIIKQSGVEIDDSKYTIDLNGVTGNHELDTYTAVSSSSNDPLKVTKIAEGLDQAVYTIEITVLDSKNASSTDYRYYDYGISTTDGVTAGEIGVDAIIDNPFDRNRWIGTGNLEYAVSVRTTTSTDTADSEFVTGTHGLETAPSGVLVIIDDVDVTTAYNSGAIGDEWTGNSIKVSYQTQAEYPDAAGTYWATIDYSFTYTRSGVTVDVVREVTNPVRMDTEYVCMLHAPDNSTTTTDPVNNPLTGIGGGFADWVVDGDQRYYRPDGYPTNATLLPPTKSLAAYNDNYAAIASIVSIDAFLAGSDGDRGVFQKRISENDNSSKAYITTMKSVAVGGDEVPVGHTLTARTRYRVIEGDVSVIV